MIIKNVDNAPYSEKHGTYGGMSGLKDGVVINGEDWIIKYPKNASSLRRHEEMTYTNDPVSEYIGSHIYEMLGYPVHKTELVERRGKIAVACKDFINENDREKLIEMRTIKNAANEALEEMLERSLGSTGTAHTVDLEEILLHMKYNEVLHMIKGVEERFWDMSVIDIYLNNSDRNNGNWGIIRTPGKPDRLAPIFDNGGSLNGKTPDSRLEKMLYAPDVMVASITSCNTSFGEKGIPIPAKEFLQMDFSWYGRERLDRALMKNVPKIISKEQDIKDMIDRIPDFACSHIRKEFYKKSLTLRLEKLLQPAYEIAISQHKNKAERMREKKFVEIAKEAFELETWFIGALSGGIDPPRDIKQVITNDDDSVSITYSKPRYCGLSDRRYHNLDTGDHTVTYTLYDGELRLNGGDVFPSLAGWNNAEYAEKAAGFFREWGLDVPEDIARAAGEDIEEDEYER